MISIEARSEQKERSEPFKAAQPMAHAKPLVLVAEDHEDSRSLLKALLEMWGYRVAEAANGAEAVSLACELIPDLVLMDVGLPLIDGITAADQIHEFTNLAILPVVFTSGHPETSLRESALERDGVAYLIKPIDFEKLRIVLSKYIQNTL